MRNFPSIYQDSASIYENSTKSGLSCVWVPVREGEEVRLVARWVKPEAEADWPNEEEDSHDWEEVSES